MVKKREKPHPSIQAAANRDFCDPRIFAEGAAVGGGSPRHTRVFLCFHEIPDFLMKTRKKKAPPPRHFFWTSSAGESLLKGSKKWCL